MVLAGLSSLTGGRFSHLRSLRVPAMVLSPAAKALVRASRGGGVVEFAIAGVKEAVAYPEY
jgi:hypothetical protein